MWVIVFMIIIVSVVRIFIESAEGSCVELISSKLKVNINNFKIIDNKTESIFE